MYGFAKIPQIACHFENSGFIILEVNIRDKATFYRIGRSPSNQFDQVSRSTWIASDSGIIPEVVKQYNALWWRAPIANIEEIQLWIHN